MNDLTPGLIECIRELQPQVYAWKQRNFPTSTARLELMGVVEEMGELAHAFVKMEEGIRGTSEQHILNAQDAVGDILIYLLNFSSEVGIHDYPLSHATVPDDDFFELVTAITSLIRMFQVEEQTAPNTQIPHERVNYITHCITYVIRVLEVFCLRREWSMEAILRNTWKSVRMRDWIKNVETGQPDAADLVRDPG